MGVEGEFKVKMEEIGSGRSVRVAEDVGVGRLGEEIVEKEVE